MSRTIRWTSKLLSRALDHCWWGCQPYLNFLSEMSWFCYTYFWNWVCTTACITLPMLQRRDMKQYTDGLESEFFLWIGMTGPQFHGHGHIPCAKHSSNRWLSGLASSAHHSFSSLVGTSSRPVALFSFNLHKSFLMSLDCVVLCVWSCPWHFVELAFLGKSLC